MTDLTTLAGVLPANLVDAMHQAHAFAQAAKSDNTKRAYTADWQHFHNWCADHGLPALPATPTTVVLYLSQLAASLKPATLARRLTTIAEAHRTANQASPTDHPAVRLVLAGIRWLKGTAQKGKAPLLTADLLKMLAQLPDDRQGRRDQALMLIGFAGAFRRSELVAIDVEDLAFTADGVVITLRRSKTDQEGQGIEVAIPVGHGDTCPVTALQAWLDHGQITTGPVFRPVTKGDRVRDQRLSDKAVALILQKLAQAAGLQKDIAGHSLRAGFATQAAIQGAADRDIMRQTRHTTRAMLDRYVRKGTQFQDNAASKLGL